MQVHDAGSVLARARPAAMAHERSTGLIRNSPSPHRNALKIENVLTEQGHFGSAGAAAATSAGVVARAS